MDATTSTTSTTTNPAPIPPHVNLLHQVLNIILGPDHNIDLVDLYPSKVEDIRSTRRAYHNTYHIFDCIGFLWSNRDHLLPTIVGCSEEEEVDTNNEMRSNDGCTKQQLDDLIITSLALYYHDVIYDPTRGDNEELSAQHAVDTLGKLLTTKGMNNGQSPLWAPTPNTIDIIHDLIMATKKHAVPEDWLRLSTEDENQPQQRCQEQQQQPSPWRTMNQTPPPTPKHARQYIRLLSAVLDTDLSIIATNSTDQVPQQPSSSSSSSSSPPSSPTLSRFTIYENQIRQEYQHYPIGDYGIGRSKVMAHFAQRGNKLFFTQWAQTTLSPIAINNLKLITPEKYSVEKGWDDKAIVKTFWDFCPVRYEELIHIFTQIITTLTTASRQFDSL